jgi:hypothetical protein
VLYNKHYEGKKHGFSFRTTHWHTWAEQHRMWCAHSFGVPTTGILDHDVRDQPRGNK